ncbi:PREDICTED: uncharacterized protein LOC106897672 [Calidris pugnax]|uniref:uncharacterized protein LOC106897672 n=1 Tax=Calidris pugnax TaxID=198806 RepID=UPI00071DBD02|nr:PREDICTED: uncharacterized protein LOC106897672 [Calidris pugnax]
MAFPPLENHYHNHYGDSEAGAVVPHVPGDLHAPPSWVLPCMHNFCSTKTVTTSLLTTEPETEKLISELAASATDTKDVISTAGLALLKGIRYRMAELQSRLHHDYSTKLEKLQAISNKAKAFGRLYQQMEALLEQNENSVQFLQEDTKKNIKEKVEKALEGKASNQREPKHKISMQEYFEELIGGINIKASVSTACEEVLPSTTDLTEMCRPKGPAFEFSDEGPDHPFLQESAAGRF